MSTELQIFNNPEFGKITTAIIDGKEHFAASECAKILGYADPKDAISRHCRWVVKHPIPHPQSPDKILEINFIPEGDLYRLIVRSNLPAVEKFEKWVFDEVLPSIRKTGKYEMKPKSLAELTLEVIEGQKRLIEEQGKRIDKAIEYFKEKKNDIAFVEGLKNEQVDRRIDGNIVVDVLNNLGINIGLKRLYQLLNDKGWLTKTPRYATQRAKEGGYMVNDIHVGTNDNGTQYESKTPKFLIKGIIKICSWHNVKCTVQDVIKAIENI